MKRMKVASVWLPVQMNTLLRGCWETVCVAGCRVSNMHLTLQLCYEMHADAQVIKKAKLHCNEISSCRFQVVNIHGYKWMHMCQTLCSPTGIGKGHRKVLGRCADALCIHAELA